VPDLLQTAEYALSLAGADPGLPGDADRVRAVDALQARRQRFSDGTRRLTVVIAAAAPGGPVRMGACLSFCRSMTWLEVEMSVNADTLTRVTAVLAALAVTAVAAMISYEHTGPAAAPAPAGPGPQPSARHHRHTSGTMPKPASPRAAQARQPVTRP